MNYTKKYSQVSKNAARSKFGRMANGKGWQSSISNFECGFSTWWWGKDMEEPENPHEDPFWNGGYAIYVSTNYHSEATLNEMYKTNCKDWG